MLQKLALFILVLILASCNNSSLTSSIHEPAFMPDEITMIPGEDKTSEDKASEDSAADSSTPDSGTNPPSTSQKPSVSGTPRVRPTSPKPSVSGTAQINPQVKPPVNPSVTVPKIKPRVAFPKSAVKMSKIIENAYLVMNNAKDIAWIKTACNRYVSLVLARSGYSRDGFLANDFDVYAQKNLKQAKDVLFKGDVALAAEHARLKQHIWSYPERTPFILQWTRTGPHGHVAILERVGDKLFIFQSSLGDYDPRVNEIKVTSLLNSRGTKHLTVYSDL